MRDYRENDYYFAAAPLGKLGEELVAKVDDYYAYLTSSSLVDLWRRSFYSYYGLEEDTNNSGYGIFKVGSIKPRGSKGEIASIKVNHLRNLITHQHVLTTQQRLALKCKAKNSDSRSLSQAILGDGLLDYYLKEHKIENYFRDVVETALIFGEGFIEIGWDVMGGDIYATDENGRDIHQGELKCRPYHPFDVVRDVTDSSAEVNWHILHKTRNRFDMSVTYPHVSREILSVCSDITTGKRYVDPTKIIPAAGVGTKRTDLIDVYEFYHQKTPSIPDGRYTIFLSDGTILFDGSLPYDDYPIYRIAAANIKGSPFGYTISFDALGIQQLIDKLYTAVSTNQLSTGVQNFWQPTGNQLTPVEISGGLNLLESAVKPEVLELCQTPAEVFGFIDKLERILEILFGVSEVNRGGTPESLKSGTSLAFVASQAITFSSGLQNSYAQLKRDVSRGIIKILQRYVSVEKKTLIAGETNRPMLKAYTGDSISQIDRVDVEEVSPMMKTPQGMMEIANTLLQSGMIRSPKEYITAINTGNVDPMYESEQSESILIRSENEAMRGYRKPIMLASDDHRRHWLEHRVVIANVDAREDPQLVAVVTEHMSEHMNMLMQMQANNPAALAMMGESPLPMPMQPMMAPQPSGINSTLGSAEPNAEQVANEIKPPRMPNLPKNADLQSQQAYGELQGIGQ